MIRSIQRVEGRDAATGFSDFIPRCFSPPVPGELGTEVQSIVRFLRTTPRWRIGGCERSECFEKGEGFFFQERDVHTKLKPTKKLNSKVHGGSFKIFLAPWHWEHFCVWYNFCWYTPPPRCFGPYPFWAINQNRLKFWILSQVDLDGRIEVGIDFIDFFRSWFQNAQKSRGWVVD